MTKHEASCYEVYILLDVLVGIFEHCEDYIPKEAIGFLFGNGYKWKDITYAVIYAYLPLKSKSTRFSVEIMEGSIAPALNKIKAKYPEAKIVGWYHSHPNLGVFMSEIDIESHKKYFRLPYQVALVVDPVRKEYNFFKVKGNNYRPATFRVIVKREEHEKEQ